MPFLPGAFLRLPLDGRVEARLSLVDVFLRRPPLVRRHSTEHFLVILILQVEIAQHLVGLLHLQEHLLVRLLALLTAVHIGVRMILFALLEVRPLDLLVGRVYVHA